MSGVGRRQPVDSRSMVTEACDLRANCEDLLCVACGWTGHCEPHEAAWPVFMQHGCLVTDDAYQREWKRKRGEAS